MKIDIRPGQAGHNMARSIIESVHLMYQNETALLYLKELIFTLEREKKVMEVVIEREKNPYEHKVLQQVEKVKVILMEKEL